MKTICLRLMILFALAAGLNFVSEAGIKVEEGRVFIVGRCLIDKTNGLNTLLNSEKLMVGIAQAEFQSGADGEPVFKISRIYSVKPDSSGYFMLKNVPAGYSYIFLGAQLSSEQPLKVGSLKLVNAAEKQSRIFSLGTHVIAPERSFTQSLGSGKDLSIAEYMKHFSSGDNFTRFAHHVCNRTGYWGNGNCLTTVDAAKVILSGLKTAQWVKIGAES